MGLFFLPLLPLAIPYILGGLDFLRSQLFPPAPPTSPAPPPATDTPIYPALCTVQETLNGSPNGFPITPMQRYEIRIIDVNPPDAFFPDFKKALFYVGESSPRFVMTNSLSQGADWVVNCEPEPSSTPTTPVSDSGLPISSPPDIDTNGLKIIEGAPLVTLPNLGAALAAAIAAARAAADALAIGNAIADAFEALKPLLEKINEDAEDRDRDGKKDYIRYQFGAISRDGFLRLYPTSETNSYKAEQLDISILSIPIGYGKYFGNLSPNFYRFKELGYIAFVSPTFGIMEYREVEFSRMSLTVPSGAIGFYYHLGLDGAILGNAWGYYSQKQE